MPDLHTHLAVSSHKGSQKRKSKVSDSSSAKKRKTGTEGQPASTSSTRSSSNNNRVEGVPPWVSKSLDLFRSTSLGPEWDELVAGWLHFERTTEFMGVSKLGHQNRPPAIGDWIQRARSPTFHPNIVDLGTYSSNFDAWWRSVQPYWRMDPYSNRLLRDGDDFERIRLIGPNGLVSVIAALFFWGHKIQGSTARKSIWKERLGDVAYIIAHLI